MDKTLNIPNSNNVLNFPLAKVEEVEQIVIPTPKSDKIKLQAEKLKNLSHYTSDFDFDTYSSLEKRFGLLQPRGGITFNSPFRLVNSHHTCQQCLYSFEIDTYGRGCVHDCSYCYAKAELTVHGYWNKPFPMPVNITDVWNVFYTVFETDIKSKWRAVMEKRVPIRIGSMSDSFMFMDKKYKVTKELLKILKFYDYPYIIFTRSDLIAEDEYLNVLDNELCSIQMSISSTNDSLNKQIEPGAPSAKRRLNALEKMVKNGYWTTVRLNPFFPIYPDGYFSDPNFSKKNMPKPFHYSSFEMVDEITEKGVQSILAGMVRLSHISLSALERSIGRDLKSFYKSEKKQSMPNSKSKRKSRDYHYSPEETRAYYERIHAKCIQNNVQFTTCYIGNGESQFWRDQDLWSNKKDCCNAKNRVEKIITDAREISWEERMKHTSHKHLTPNNQNDLHRELEKPIIVKDGSVELNNDVTL